MQYKKSMIIIILAIFLFSITSVCASDVNDTAIASEDTTAIELSQSGEITTTDESQKTIQTNDTEMLTASDEETTVAQNNLDTLSLEEKTYADLSNAVGSGGNINLQPAYYKYNGESDTITITHPGIINGNGAIIDMAGSTIRAFNVYTAGVTIKNLTIKNTNYTGDGGAVYFRDQGTVSNCNFTNNQATGTNSWGGAIIFLGTGNVTNCNFTGNTATGDGGAVYFWDQGTVSNCNFTGNTATGDGGAVYFNSKGNVTNCNFTGNNATTGSAIYFYSTSATKNVFNSRFLNNRANAEALEITKNDNNITITFTGRNNLLNAIYSSNDAEVAFNNVTYWGANGIATVSATMSGSNKATGQNITVGVVVNGKVVLNEVKVTDENGMIVLPIIAGENYYIGVRHDADSYYTEAEKTISNNTKLSANVTSQTTTNKTVNITAKSNIYSEFMPGKLLFILPNGTEINATYAAGGIWWAVNTFEGYGVYQVNASYDGLNNVTVNKGTIAVTAPEHTFWFLNYTINGKDKGEINLTNDYYYDSAYDEAFAKGIVINRKVTINGNGYTIDAKGKARVFNVQADDVTIKNLTIKNANYNGNGGAIYFSSSGTVTNCNFTNNKAIGNYGGGAIHLVGAGNVTNCNFTNNSANQGGAIRVGDKITLKNCNFINNKAEAVGGAFSSSSSSTLESNIIDCNFVNNTAYECGAAFINRGRVENCNFTNNKATRVVTLLYIGGVIFIGEGNVTNCNFVNNTASHNCGAVSIVSGSVENCNFTDNTATNGNCGAVYFMSSGNVANCNFVNNSASRDGGAVYFSDKGTVTNCNFTGNNAITGSAIYFNSILSTRTVSNSRFLNNRANSETLKVTKNDNNITITFTGKDNLLNAIYSDEDVSFTNVTYWGAKGITNTDSSTPARAYKEAGQNITVEIYDSNDNLVENVTLVTDNNGQVKYDYIKLSNGNYTYKAYHSEDRYYTYLDATGNFTLNSDWGDFNRLQSYINRADANSVLTLNRNYTFTIGLDENLTGGIVIDKPLTINGNDHTINALGKARIFKVTASSINITGLTFKNGRISGNGGAIYFESALSNSNLNATFINNTATNNGGANFFNNVLNNITITGNYTQNKAQYGGANYYNAALNNTNINGNYNNNTATYYGGANRFWDTLNNVNINGNYTQNKAQYGGANYYNAALNNTNINGNYNNNTATKGNGGANNFNNKLTNTNINGNYNNNTAQKNGGANLFWNTLNNVNITGNYSNNLANGTQSETGGGANYFQNTLTSVNITGNYNNNTAYNGGANHFQNTLTNITITGNYNNNTAQNGYGGANHFQETLTNTIINGNYTNNKAEQDGGANFFNEVNNVTIIGNYINNTGNSTIYMANSNQNNIIKDSIFINDVQHIKVDSGKILSINNWFGNNATNYNITPNVTNVDMDHWLFLNATANPNTISIAETSNITFKLYLYNATSKNITDCDNSLLQPIELTLNATNGEIDKKTTALNSTVKYTQKNSGKGSVTATFENVRQTVDFEINRFDPQLSIQANEITYGENATITLDYNSTATGKVNITLTGKKHNKNYENQTLKNTITLKDNILPDEYTITVTYSGDKNFQNATAYGNLTVKSLDSNMKVTGHTINVTDTNGVIFTVTLPENATGKLNISNKSTINVAEYGTKKNNNLIIDITNAAYPVGQYNWTFTYYDDDIYTDSTINATANILIIKTQITPTNKTINLTVGDSFKITYTLNPANAVGNITFTSSNPSIANVDTKGNIKATGYGSAVITVNFEGCENYTPSNANVSFNVAKAQSTLDINGTSIYFGEDAILNYTTVNATGIEVTITDWLETPLTEGIDYNITITDTQIILKFFDDGIHYVNVTTKTDKNHNPTTKKVTVHVNPICDLEIILNPMNQTANYGDAINWTATIINNGPSYALKSYFDVYASEGLVFTNHNVHAYLNHYRVAVPYPLPAGYSFTILINAMVNVSNADLTLNVSVCDEYSPDPNPKNNNASATVEIRYATATVNISAKNEITFGDNLIINVELPNDATGNITASINGKNYTQDVKNGTATITIPKPDAGDNTVNITYSGDKKYNPAEKTLKVNVKKATPKMTAKAKTFKDTTKTKKYTITLKDNKGNPIKNAKVYLKVKGTKYTATTNSKGQATFKITKLTKKGKYTATITYKGNKNYNKITKKAKITVKQTWKTISKGSKNHAMVKKIQKALKKNGYYITYKGHYLKIDGIYHDCTERSVKQFQKAKKLKVTGKVDYNTAKKLKLI